MADHTNILLLQINEIISGYSQHLKIIQKCLKTLNADLSEYIIYSLHTCLCACVGALYLDTQAKIHLASMVVRPRELHRAAMVVRRRKFHQATMVVKDF